MTTDPVTPVTPVTPVALARRIAARPERVLSVVAGPLDGPPAVLRNADVPHQAASTMKVAVLAALYASGLDLDAEIPVVNRFASAVGGGFSNDPDWDSDPEPWRLLDSGTAPLRWLAERMITHSSNLATNLCLAQVGHDAVAEVWRRAGASRSASPRGIEDHRARAAGVDNQVTALDLARLLRSLSPELLDLLERNTWRVDLAAGLPPGTRIAFKNGWIPGVRHSAGVVRPPDAAPYVIAVCYTGPLATGHDEHDPAAGLLARISARAWARRREPAALLAQSVGQNGW
ncbi:beta-lactamase class A [Kitasatospora sp. MAP12-15]|uniref:class A beta-lactamase-related serine hydrolase n=1 Tax=unclassified Kitasatospora TaxID=2633591 RepID=UPI002476C8BB|nr:class A beta-lactamase-related serine hydrolase [Kitasatospora sp. MAP12-44]MDH6109050.1 beta-lactamase class A [Kitasatospora sp. MAP12-44]